MSGPTETLNKDELEQIVLLKGVPLESILGILEACPIREVKKDDFLIRGGEKNEFLYLLLSGRLRVHLRLKFGPIATLEAGEIVGDISLIDKGVATAHVVADEDSRLLALDETAMWSLIDAHTPIAWNFLFILANRLRRGNALMATGPRFSEEHQRFAVQDTLTGLHNARWLNDALPPEMERARKEGSRLSLLLVGVDSFPDYKQAHGPAAADRALYAIARALRTVMSPDGMLVRYKEDEFVVILPGTDAASSCALGERLCEIAAETEVRGLDQTLFPQVTVSVGAVEMTQQDTPETLLAAAETALREAREQGGGRASKMERSA